MPYAISNPIHGEPVAWRYIGNESDLLADEILVEEMPPEPIWDNDIKAVVSAQPTQVTTLQKRRKKDQLRQEVKEELEAIFPDLGLWEYTYLLATRPTDEKVLKANEIMNRLDQAEVRVDVAHRLDDVEAQSW